MSKEIFDTAVRTANDIAGVFEFDGEVAFFYLYDLKKEKGKMILDSIRVFTEDENFLEKDVNICWNQQETIVGLFIRSTLFAIFDTLNHKKYGRNSNIAEYESLPPEANNWFIKVHLN